MRTADLFRSNGRLTVKSRCESWRTAPYPFRGRELAPCCAGRTSLRANEKRSRCHEESVPLNTLILTKPISSGSYCSCSLIIVAHPNKATLTTLPTDKNAIKIRHTPSHVVAVNCLWAKRRYHSARAGMTRIRFVAWVCCDHHDLEDVPRDRRARFANHGGDDYPHEAWEWRVRRV